MSTKKQSAADIAKRIKALRESLPSLTQQQFSKAIAESRSAVAAFESGARIPTAASYLKIGNFAASRQLYDEALWFWRRAGLDTQQMLYASGHVFRGRGMSFGPEMVAVAPELDSPPATIEIDAVARILRLSVGEVLRLADKGEIKAGRMPPDAPWFYFDSVAEYLKRTRAKSDPETVKK